MCTKTKTTGWDRSHGLKTAPFASAGSEAGFLLMCCAAVLFWAMPASGAEPNASRPPAPATPVAQPKSSKVSPPSPKAGTAPAAAATPSSPAAVVNPVLQSTDEPDSNAVMTNGLRSRLWQSRILPPDPNEDAETKAALQDLIQRLKTITTERSVNKPGPAKPAILDQLAQTSKNASPTPGPTELSGVSMGPAAREPNATLPPATVEKLNRLMQDPNQVRNPLDMAELLFLNNCPAEAAVFYEKALALTQPNDPATSDDRAWILLQLGTSLRQTNATKARDAYLKLITEFPNSPWTELAKANGRLLNWYQSTKPQQLISSPTP